MNPNSVDIIELYPKAPTIEKALSLIQCAYKQGRQNIRMLSNSDVANKLSAKGFNSNKYAYPPIYDNVYNRIFTVSWDHCAY